jgi:nucleotide-binding universal stress UspA family protein
MAPYRNVVVGTDGSPTATAAVTAAAELASASGARLTVVTAFAPHPAQTARAMEEAPEEIKWRITESGQADEKAGEACRLARGLGVKDVRARSEPGDPAEALIGVAEDTGGDVIVVWAACPTKCPTTPRATSSSSTPSTEPASALSVWRT